jgi:hypothetical protein
MELKDIKFEDTAFFEESYLARVFPFPQYSNLLFDIDPDRNLSTTGTDINSIDSRVGSNGVTAVVSQEPTLEENALNGRNAVVCDGTQNMDFNSAVSATGEFTRITVIEFSATSPNFFFYGNAGTNVIEGNEGGEYGTRLFNGASASTVPWPVGVDTPLIITLTRNASDKVDVYFNQGTANRLFGDVAQSGTHTISQFTNRASSNWRGKIYRSTQWSVELTDQERFEAVKILQEYYGLS